jgi:hypothetical protein
VYGPVRQSSNVEDIRDRCAKPVPWREINSSSSIGIRKEGIQDLEPSQQSRPELSARFSPV